ncbi:MAG: Uma2 family endonuclease [Cyanobacteria bacterium P01_F01_bin.143]
MNLAIDTQKTSEYKIFVEFIKEFNLQRKDDKGDDLYLFSNVSWSEYENLLTDLGDISWCRIAYLDGLLEIMAPGRKHETIKELTGMLIVAYCDEKEIDYFSFGSKTLKNEESQVGKEPDTSYAIELDKKFPDIAVEVNQSSGSINDLEKYQRLGIKEVWVWDKNDNLEFYILIDNKYRKSSKSKFLSNLESSIVQDYVNVMKEKGARIGKKEFIQKIKDL